MTENAKPPGGATSVVLVHGAFADGSSWRKLIPALQAAGLHVAAVQNPLTSLAEDVAFTRRMLDLQSGPVVLVGHSWGGAVITAAGVHPKVKALVYVAAFAPAAGEASVEVVKRHAPMPGKQGRIESPDGFQWLSETSLRENFAQDLDAGEAALLAATQGAVWAKAFEEKVEVAAWRDRPSWYVVATQDRMIHPEAQREFARRIGAQVTELASSHVPMLSQPDAVAAVILSAARAAG